MNRKVLYIYAIAVCIMLSLGAYAQITTTTIKGTGTSEFAGDVNGSGSSIYFDNYTGINFIITGVLNSTSAGIFTTVDTGQGANELYDMNQNVNITDDVTFNRLYINSTNPSLDMVDTNDGSGGAQFSLLRFKDEGGSDKWYFERFGDSHVNPGDQNSFGLFQKENKSDVTVDRWGFYFNDLGLMEIGSNTPTEKLSVSGNFSTTTSSYLATNSGKVGIATKNPTHTLDVQGNVSIEDLLYFTDDKHILFILNTTTGSPRSNVVNLNGMGNDALVYVDTSDKAAGSVMWMMANQPSLGNLSTLVLSGWSQIGENNSFSSITNSFVPVRNDICSADGRFNNGTICDMDNISDYLVYCEWLEDNGTLQEPCVLAADTSGRKVPMIGAGDLEVHRTATIHESFTNLRNFLHEGKDGNDFVIATSSLHLENEGLFEETLSGNITEIMENFDSGLGVFTAVTTGGGIQEWSNTVDFIACQDSPCASSVGGSSIDRIMEVNFSTTNLTDVNISFYYTLTGNQGTDDFDVEVNNNTGSGFVNVFADDSTQALTFQNITLSSDYWNTSIVTLRYIYNANQVADEAFVDTVEVFGAAANPTKLNVTRFNSEICLSNAERLANGKCKYGIYWNDSTKTLELPGNTSFGDVTETSLNITDSISLNGTTITDWSEVVNAPNFFVGWTISGSDIYTNFNTGIGTSTPSTKLQIVDTSSTDILRVDGTGNTGRSIYAYSNTPANASAPLMELHADNTAFDQPLLELKNDGANYGIHLTQANDFDALRVDNTGNSERGIYVYSNEPATSNNPIMELVADNVGFDQTVLEIINDGAGAGLTIDSTDFVVDTSGNVGIGTNSPSGNLDIRGNNFYFGPNKEYRNEISGGQSFVKLNTDSSTMNFQMNRSGSFITPLMIQGAAGATGTVQVTGNLTISDTDTGGNAGTDICIDASNRLCRCGSCA